MKLVSVKVRNFRSIKDNRIDFEPTCRVLVGINESGKSNLLKALRLLADDFSPSRVDDVREPLAGEAAIETAYVRFQFRLEKAETNELRSEISKSILSKQPNPTICTKGATNLRLDQFCLTRDSAALYEVDLLKEKAATMYWSMPDSMQIADGWHKPSAECPADYEVLSGEQTKLLKSFKLVRSKDFPDIAPAYLSPAETDDLNQLSGGAIVSIARRERPTTVFWQYDEEFLLPSSVEIASFAANPEKHLPLKNMFVLAGIAQEQIGPSLSDVQKGSHNLVQNYLDRIAERTTAHFRSVWKEYRNVSFSLRINGSAIIPGIKEENTHDFARRSDGFKRFVTFLLIVSARDQAKQMENTLLLIDEPEISLHPSGARYLRDELLRISKHNYVVYSTHSIFMIDSADVGRHYVVTKKGEITTIQPAAESNIVEEEVLWNALGHSAFSVLKEKNLIFEGWKDKRLFEVAIATATSALKRKFQSVGICHAKGASSIKSITPIMKLASRDCLILSDSDGPALSEQKRYKADKGYGTWLTYQEVDKSITAVTGEDFVKRGAIARAVNEALKGKSLPAFSETDLPADGNRLKAIRNWLIKHSVTQDQAKDIIDETKNQLFDTLAATDLEPKYTTLLEGIEL